MRFRRLVNVRGGLCFALAGMALVVSAADAAELEVTAEHVVPGPGSIHFVLYRGPEGFRHEDRAFRVLKAPAGAGSISVRFRDVPPGRYAVMAYHDADNDQKLDLRFGMFPKEGWGLSNNPKVMGPPGFAASSFSLGDKNGSTIIDMQY